MPWDREQPQRDVCAEVESMRIQLSESNRFIEVGSVTHLRLAYILIDNAVEILLLRKLSDLLLFNSLNERMHAEMNLIVAKAESLGLNEEVQRAGEFRDEIDKELINFKQRRELSRYFRPKAEFLVSRGVLEKHTADAILVFHEYRNDLYHNDRLNVDILYSTTCIYFGLACELFSKLRADVSNILADDILSNMEEPAKALSESLQMQLDHVATHLRNHIAGRIQQIKTILQEWFGEAAELYADLIIRLVIQESDKSTPDAAKRYKCIKGYGVQKFLEWEDRANSLIDTKDQRLLLIEFAGIESQMKPLEEVMDEFNSDMWRSVQLEIDLRRGL